MAVKKAAKKVAARKAVKKAAKKAAKKATKKAAKKAVKKAAKKTAKKAAVATRRSSRPPAKAARRATLSSTRSRTALSTTIVAERRPTEADREQIASFLSAPVTALSPVEARTLEALDALGTRLSPVTHARPEGLRAIATGIDIQMDPRLQLALVNRRTGKRSLALASASDDEIPVVARVTDADAWAELDDVFPGAKLGKVEDGSWIVTGRVPLDRIETVRKAPAVLSLKSSQPMTASLSRTTEAMRVRPDMIPPKTSPAGAKGVVVGIIDFGGDFAHPNFRHKDGSTRLIALWNQSDTAIAGGKMRYGRAYDQKQINAALGQHNPYHHLRYQPEKASHGTHVMDIAAGNGLGTGIPGVATDADLVFVEASAADIAWNGPQSARVSFGDSVQMLEAIQFVFDQAGDRPCVVNLSLGTNGGPHDGSSLVEQGIDVLVNAKPNRAVVIAASNSFQDGIHASGAVPAKGHLDLEWKVLGHAGGELELWYEGDSHLRVTLIAPDGTPVSTVEPGRNETLAADNKAAIFISNRLNDPNNRCHVISIWLAGGLDGGDWKVRLKSVAGVAVDYHAWAERLDSAQSCFVHPDPSFTLGSISTGRESVVVGSHDAYSAKFALSPFSSSGPTRDGREKPEISAPGHNVLAACSLVPDGIVRKSGTSMAAPAVTGLIALILAEAARNNQSLTSAQLRQRLIHHADASPEHVGPWHPRYGAGRASSKSI